MEIIIVLVAAALAVAIYLGRKKPAEPGSVDAWEPPKELHVTVADTVTTVVENKVETPAEPPAPAKKAPAKKPAAKKAPAKKPAAKKAPAKKTTK